MNHHEPISQNLAMARFSKSRHGEIFKTSLWRDYESDSHYHTLDHYLEFIVSRNLFPLPGQGSVLSLRLNVDADPDQPSKLFFDDGGVKGLACFICFLGLATLAPDLSPDDLAHAKVKLLIESMLRIATIYKQQDMSNPVDSQIMRVVKQNQDAAAQPVSSFGWSCLLRKLSGAIAEEGIDFDAALQLYNQHPMVQIAGETVAWMHSSSQRSKFHPTVSYKDYVAGTVR